MRHSSKTYKVISLIRKNKSFLLSKNAVENNEAHVNESVYEHTNIIVKKLEKIILLLMNRGTIKNDAQDYFNLKIGRYTRLELLIIVAYLHDIGKVTTIEIDAGGNTKCPGHEKESVRIAKVILKSADLNKEELDYILSVVRLHSGYSLKVLDHIMCMGNVDVILTLKSVSFIPEIFLFMIADNGDVKAFRKYYKFLYKVVSTVKEIYEPHNFIGKPMEIGKNTQMLLRQSKENSKPWTIDVRLLHLNEEVGELNDIYLQYIGVKDRAQGIKDIAIALNDVFVELISIYDQFGLNLALELKKEVEKRNE